MEFNELKQELEAIKARNARVEADKAWETSFARVATICIITYFTAAGVMRAIGVNDYWLNALIPTVGFFLSTQSLPIIKNQWLKSHTKKDN